MSIRILPLKLILISLLIILVLLYGCSRMPPPVSAVSFEQVISDPLKYNGKSIAIVAFYFHGFEVNVLCNNLKYSGYAEQHLIPDGDLIWLEGNIPSEIYNKLHVQQMMGPDEHFGKVKIQGKFQYGNKYGHLSSYKCQITATVIELLPWSP